MPVETMFHELLLTFLTAMVPVLELRGAIPVGVAAGLPPAAACAAAPISASVPTLPAMRPSWKACAPSGGCCTRWWSPSPWVPATSVPP